MDHPMALYRMFLLFFLVAAFLIPSPLSAAPQTTAIIIGTGGPGGVYYFTGTTIAKILSKNYAAHNLRATVASNDRSDFIINAVLTGDFDFGMVQSIRQFQAFNGQAEWRDKGPRAELRSVFSIHPEVITLCATVFSGVTDIRDLQGKRVNISNPGSDQRQNAIAALQAVGIDWQKDLKAEGIRAIQAPGLIQDGRLDAFFYTVTHPSDAFKEATHGNTRLRFIPIKGIAKLLETHPYYTKAYVPISFYPDAANEDDVETFGLTATLVTSINVPKEIVYTLTKEVFDNFDWFKKQHPAYHALTRESMLEGLSAPIHPGAMQYFKETGLK